MAMSTDGQDSEMPAAKKPSCFEEGTLIIKNFSIYSLPFKQSRSLADAQNDNQQTSSTPQQSTRVAGVRNDGKAPWVRQVGQRIVGIGHCLPAQHFLYFFPLPHGHGSLRPTLGFSNLMGLVTVSPCGAIAAARWRCAVSNWLTSCFCVCAAR